MKIIHLKSGEIIAKNAKYADTFASRLLGLMFIPKMVGMDALILEPCQSIHNFFVRFSLDVVFLNRDNQVVKIIRDFKPWRISGYYFKARRVVEMPAGQLMIDINVGDVLEVRDV